MVVTMEAFDVDDVHDQENSPTFLEDQNEQEPEPLQDNHQQDVDSPAFDVDDAHDQENSLTVLEDQNEQEPEPLQDNHQQDVEQETTLIVVRIPKEKEQVSPMSSLTMESDFNSNQFIMENFSFSLSSLPRRTSTPDMYFCRICHQRSLSEPNLSPCHCRGTMGLIHKSCLEQWLAASDSTKCEICHFNFTIKRKPKFGILKSIGIWLQSEECKGDRLHMIFDAVRFIVSLPLILVLNHLTATLFETFLFDDEETCDLYSFLTNIESNLNISSIKDVIILTGRFMTYLSVGFMSAMDVMAIGWLFSKIEEHYQTWHKWYRTQCVINVILPESSEEELENK